MGAYVALGTPIYTTLAELVADHGAYFHTIGGLTEASTLGALREGYIYFLFNVDEIGVQVSGQQIEGMRYLSQKSLDSGSTFIQAQGDAVAYVSKVNLIQGSFSVSTPEVAADKALLTVGTVVTANYYNYLADVNVLLTDSGQLDFVNGLTRCIVKLTAQTLPIENGFYTYIYDPVDDSYTLTAVGFNTVAFLTTGIEAIDTQDVVGAIYETSQSLILAFLSTFVPS